MPTEFHIGIDDTDSKFGGCTTYTAALIFEELVKKQLQPADLPWLVRLNPNIPWKTRGNGALAIHLLADDSQLDQAKQVTLNTVKKTSDPSIPATDPAVVFLRGKIPDALEAFTTKALHDVIRVEEADRLVKGAGGEAHTFRGRRGIIGALAAIGYGPNRDHTYEIIAYRSKRNLGKSRKVDLGSVRSMDHRRQGQTFNSVDPETKRVLVCPHGPDPVLLGIRGEHPQSLLEALDEVEVQEPIERVMLFKTNQGTDAHLTNQTSIKLMRPYQSVSVTGTVETRPIVIRGGHVIFKLHDETGLVDCAAYKPTGYLKQVALQLIPGDKIRAFGGIRPGPYADLTLNLEKMEILRLAWDVELAYPLCSRCGSSCESMGRGQGLRCRKCALRFPRDSATPTIRDRRLREGLYIPPPRANRHLTKPRSRYAIPKSGRTMRPTPRDFEPILREENDLSQFVKLLERGRLASSLQL